MYLVGVWHSYHQNSYCTLYCNVFVAVPLHITNEQNRTFKFSDLDIAMHGPTAWIHVGTSFYIFVFAIRLEVNHSGKRSVTNETDPICFICLKHVSIERLWMWRDEENGSKELNVCGVQSVVQFIYQFISAD